MSILLADARDEIYNSTAADHDESEYSAAAHKILRAEGPADLLRVCHSQVAPHVFTPTASLE